MFQKWKLMFQSTPSMSQKQDVSEFLNILNIFLNNIKVRIKESLKYI